MGNEKFTLDFQLHTHQGAVPSPIKINVLEAPQGSAGQKSAKPPSAINYNSLAQTMVGLSLVKMQSQYPKIGNESSHMNRFANLAWKSLDPHFELYWKTQNKLRDLVDQKSTAQADRIDELEKSYDTTIQQALDSSGLDFKILGSYLERLEGFESRNKGLFIYNFALKFSNTFIEKLHTLYSFLFHVRCLIATHHNMQNQGNPFKVLRVDSLSDYLPGADYIANDTALYFNYREISKPFSGHKNSDARIEKLLLEPLQRGFKQWTQSAIHLSTSIPPEYLSRFKMPLSEQDLYQIQMDWLLGAPSGLLFRIREELFGIVHGYEQVFWPDAMDDSHYESQTLSYSLNLHERDLFGNNATVA